MRVLLLGGTTEAGQLAQALAAAGIDAVYSYAGRTEQPQAQPIPQRRGGFGGIDGLKHWLGAEGITHVVDATHPFAAQMSRHAMAACAALSLPLMGFERPAWTPVPGDRWTHVPDVAAAVAALPAEPTGIFLAIGRQELAPFAAAPQHHYLLRLVDALRVVHLADTTTVIARGPFTTEGDLALLRDHAVGLIVAKNAGSAGARAKLDAARTLDLPVILIDRPVYPAGRATAGSVADIMDWLQGHSARLGV
jgi:precorrin-6A/cobalt-precorrin-6A reductase